MKRTLLFLIIAFCAIGLFAQMKVYNDGRISNLNYNHTNDAFITGVLTTRALPCFNEECPLAKGLYILKVYDINEQVDMFKFIKK